MYMYVHVRMSVYCQCLSEQALCTQFPLYTLHGVVVQEHRLRGFTSEVTVYTCTHRVHGPFSCDDYHSHHDMLTMGSVEYIHM